MPASLRRDQIAVWLSTIRKHEEDNEQILMRPEQTLSHEDVSLLTERLHLNLDEPAARRTNDEVYGAIIDIGGIDGKSTC